MADIAVITPSLNQGPFLRECIESVLRNSESGLDVEYFVEDGGSTDSSIQVLKSFPQIRWVSEKDFGHAHAINKGLAKTTAPILCYLNSDDTLESGTFSYVVDFFRRNPDTDLLYGDANYTDVHSNITGKYLTRDWDPPTFLTECFICQPAAFFSRRIYEQIGGFREDLTCSFDYDFWLRILLSGGTVRRSHKVLANFRHYPAIKSLAKRDLVYLENFRLLKDHLGYCPSHWIDSYIRYRRRMKPNTFLSFLLPRKTQSMKRLAQLLEKFSRI